MAPVSYHTRRFPQPGAPRVPVGVFTWVPLKLSSVTPTSTGRLEIPAMAQLKLRVSFDLPSRERLWKHYKARFLFAGDNSLYGVNGLRSFKKFESLKANCELVRVGNKKKGLLENIWMCEKMGLE
ncbi:hypothetical protein B9Q06_11495 [Candidatus Marsarchaeota G2 archaeon ECH_B_2]|uniref:Uncharacterized protein n=4 Tax=Candidatus Marsarchaeota group 2 TaxID=2203771 RepID=A0A2R6B4V1_9ARCH|nr:MAG: hypothetical protein B9Q08_05170 [Candidatus Marsarchaeota G2 archaeon ECH_B_SAG-M15]PSN93633.1 MAG: hypothetical protein B9Q06_11495 [Candidatus Marsarchaeota G2 archaeon ECH_B_2]PSN98039.1 MAG: hypothetical protein B9Q07_10900 [Candidatus Marsarchaeota G2 archaeon ECH_B_3]PSN99535.1 MAG: hypothetical protein B9Q05_11610 [Candidatus Marsarchaeota G2 archaeon ECH_B_1]